MFTCWRSELLGYLVVSFFGATVPFNCGWLVAAFGAEEETEIVSRRTEEDF